jgi:FMN phosphatase YigB (HAD superfamily)
MACYTASILRPGASSPSRNEPQQPNERLTLAARVVAPDILHRFAAVLLDMNGTFLFGGDRFGPDQDYAASYRALGGSQLATEVVQATIQTCFDTLEEIYNDPERSDSFPQVLDTLRTLPAASGLPPAELLLLERVIAQHELGRIPDPYAVWVRRLARSHILGVVANVLSRKDLWLQEFKRAGVLDLFAVTVFSSDGPSVKPSRKLFDQAVSALAVPRSEIVFVGDNLRCDIGGAAGAGLATVWIDRDRRGRRAGDPHPDFVVGDLRELLVT